MRIRHVNINTFKEEGELNHSGLTYRMKIELPKTEQEIFDFIGPVSVPEQLEYLKFHIVRYKYLLEVVGQYFPQNSNCSK